MNIKKVFNKNDEYYTPKYAIEPLLPFLKPFKRIWCPFDLEWSNYVKMLQKDHEIIYTHKDTGGDFFKIEVPECDAIVSNLFSVIDVGTLGSTEVDQIPLSA